MGKSSTDRIKFNVGGKIFETTSTTLANAGRNSMLGSLLDDQWNIAELHANNEYFIDRNPKCFSILLDLLRTGELHIPSNVNELLLYKEAMYYGLEDHVREAKWGPFNGNCVRLNGSVSGRAPGDGTAIRAGPDGGCCVAHGSMVHVYDWMLEEHRPFSLDYQQVNDVGYIDSQNIVVTARERLGKADGGMGLFSSSSGDLRHRFRVAHDNQFKSFTAGALAFSSQESGIFASCKGRFNEYGIGVWDQTSGLQQDFFYEPPNCSLGDADKLQWLDKRNCLMVATLFPRTDNCFIGLLDFREKGVVWSWSDMFIPVCTIRLVKQPSPLKEDVKCEMPLTWDPPSLSSFIENYGTHIITSVTIGGKDVIYVKQHSLSPLSTIEIKKYVQDIGKQRFSDKQGHTNSGPVESKNKSVDTISFNGQGVYPHQPTAPYPNAKEDVTVIFRRRGGDDLIESHCHWAKTVSFAPDVIEMTFLPIASLLDGIPGKDHLIHAINLYLEYKPPIQELRYFLEFQIPRIWAPVRENRPGHQNKDSVCPYLQFSVMGQKLYISQEQVSTGRKPVSGLKLCLEGAEQNRLCIKVEHLTSLPKILRPYWDSHIAIGAPKWHGPEEQDSRWFEPVRWKKFSHVSTAPIDNCESFIGNDPSCMGVYIVTGAQLGVWNFGSKNVLYMKLLYSKIPGCTIRRSVWDHNPKKYSELAIRDDLGKILKMVDVSEMNMGPDDSPGHWLVTGGKLGVEKRKIVLRVKYSLLNY